MVSGQAHRVAVAVLGCDVEVAQQQVRVRRDLGAAIRAAPSAVHLVGELAEPGARLTKQLLTSLQRAFRRCRWWR